MSKKLIDAMVSLNGLLFHYGIKPSDVVITIPDNERSLSLETEYRSFLFPTSPGEDDFWCMGVRLRREKTRKESKSSCRYEHLMMEAA